MNSEIKVRIPAWLHDGCSELYWNSICYVKKYSESR